MKLVHHVFIRPDAPFRRELQGLGFKLDEGFEAVDVEETDARWPQVSELISVYSPLHTVFTRFTENEISGASHLSIRPSWHHLYPEPAGKFGYKSITYDNSNYCRQCGCGLLQQKPFRIRRDPRWGRNAFLQLNWVFDEFFVRPDVWANVLQSLGIGFREVLSRSEKRLETIAQLMIPQTKISHDMGDHPYEFCDACEIKKYVPFTRGFFPPLNGESELPIFKTIEYFGSGMSAHREVIVSQDFCTAVRNMKLRGIEFYPLAGKTSNRAPSE